MKLQKRIISCLMILVMALSLVPALALSAGAQTLITEVNVDGITVPVAGAHPSEITVSDDAPYSVFSSAWFAAADDASLDESAVFEDGAEYYAYIKLAPKSGYAFPSSFGEIAVTIGGETDRADAPYCRIASGDLLIYTTNYTAADASYITDVNVDGIVYPVPGAHPEVSFSVADDAPYSLGDCWWKNDTENRQMTPSDVFEAGKTYWLHVELIPDEGFRFPEDASDYSFVGFNGSADRIDYFTKLESGNLVIFSEDIFLTGLITDVNVNGFVRPAPGARPDLGLTVPDGAPYYISDCYWYNDTASTPVSADGVFEEGSLYSLCVRVGAISHYSFPESFSDISSAAFNGDGELVDLQYCSVESDDMIVMWSKSIEAETVIEIITEVNVDGFVKPVAGEHPSELYVADDAPYYIEEYFWENDNTDQRLSDTDVFMGGEEYGLTVILSPKSGYVFRGYFTNLNATFNGSSSLVSKARSTISGGKVQLCTTGITAEGASELTVITSVNVNGLVKPVAGESPSPFSVADDAPYTVAIDWSGWYTAADNSLMWSSEVFEEGKSYYAKIVLSPKNGYAFPKSDSDMTSVAIGGDAAEVDSFHIFDSKLAVFSVSYTVEPASHTAVVAGSYGEIFGSAWDAEEPANAMSLGEDGKYSITYTVGAAYDDVQFKVVYDGDWIGTGAGMEYNVAFDLTGPGTFTVVFDPSTREITVEGTIVRFVTAFEYEYVTAVGNGEGAWLNGRSWDQDASVNRMEEIAPGVFRIRFDNVPDGFGRQIKFAFDGSWDNNFGDVKEGSEFETGKWRVAVYDGGNFRFDNFEEGYIVAYLDIRSFDFTTKEGAKAAVFINEDPVPDELGICLHEYAAAVTPPTCTEQGYTTYTCSKCGDSYVDDYAAALGHDFGEWIATTPPTCEAEGVEMRTCGRCAAVESRPAAALGHDFGSDGKAEFCSRCGGKNPKYEPAPTVKFEDVPAGAYYEAAVNWAVANGITQGIGKTKFGPDNGCTRGQVVTFLWRSAGSPEPKGAGNPFGDVKDGDYYYKAVLWAVENGVTAGVSKTSFAPDATCTRGQIVTFLWRANGSPEPKSDSNPFGDVSSGDYYYRAVLWAVENGITAGVSKTSFAPGSTCTRGQIVTFLYRATVK